MESTVRNAIHKEAQKTLIFHVFSLLSVDIFKNLLHLCNYKQPDSESTPLFLPTPEFS